METKKVIKKMILITIFSLIIIFLLQFIYLVPENRYRISDQTQEIILEDYPELKEVSFMYSTDLLIEFYKKRDNLELEKINFRFNDEVIGTAEISKNIENLRKISEFMDIIGVYRFDNFKKEYSDLSDIAKEDYFDYILIVSNDEIQNTVINYSEKPISFLKLNDKESNGKKKSRFKKNAEFYNNLKIMDNMMKEYGKMHNKEYN